MLLWRAGTHARLSFSLAWSYARLGHIDLVTLVLWGRDLVAQVLLEHARQTRANFRRHTHDAVHVGRDCLPGEDLQEMFSEMVAVPVQVPGNGWIKRTAHHRAKGLAHNLLVQHIVRRPQIVGLHRLVQRAHFFLRLLRLANVNTLPVHTAEMPINN